MNTPDNHEHWQQQLAAWQATGQSGAAFCREHGLTYHRFCYWRRKLITAQLPQTTSSSGFARVVSAQSPVVEELSLSLPSGIAIRGLHAGNIPLLGAILRQL